MTPDQLDNNSPIIGPTGHLNGVDRMVLSLVTRSLVPGGVMTVTMRDCGCDHDYQATMTALDDDLFSETIITKDGKRLFRVIYNDSTGQEVVLTHEGWAV